MRSVGSIVGVFYILVGLLFWSFLDKALSALYTLQKWVNSPLLGANFTTTTMIALVVALVVTIVLWKNKKVNAFLRSVVEELKKVTWPTKLETKAATVVVIVFSIIVSLILGVFDYVFSMAPEGIFYLWQQIF